MSRDEVISVLKGNIGKPIRVVYSSGDVERVVPVNVNDEGFVADLEERGGVAAYWTRFEDVESVLPIEDQKPAPGLPGH